MSSQSLYAKRGREIGVCRVKASADMYPVKFYVGVCTKSNVKGEFEVVESLAMELTCICMYIYY